MSSTLLREAIGLNKKIFSCNYTGHNDAYFCNKKLKYFSTDVNSYGIFAKKILNTLKMSEKNYFKKLGYKNKNYIMPDSRSFYNNFKKKVYQVLKNN